MGYRNILIFLLSFIFLCPAALYPDKYPCAISIDINGQWFVFEAASDIDYINLTEYGSKKGALARDSVFTYSGNKLILKRGDRLSFTDESGVESISLFHPSEIRAGRRLLRLPEGSSVMFTPSGRVRAVCCYRGNNIRIDGHQFLPGHEIEFYPSGNLKNGFTAEKIRLHGINLHRGTGIKFYESGEMESFKEWKNDRNSVIQGIPVMNHYPCFYKNGSLKKAYLSKDYRIRGVLYRSVFRKEYFDISFYENGHVRRGGLAADHTFIMNGNEIMLRKGSAVVYDPEGRVFAVYVPEIKHVFYKGNGIELSKGDCSFAVYRNFSTKEVSALGIITDGSYIPGKKIRFDSAEVTFFKYREIKKAEYPDGFFDVAEPVSVMRTTECTVYIQDKKTLMKKFMWLDLR